MALVAGLQNDLIWKGHRCQHRAAAGVQIGGYLRAQLLFQLDPSTLADRVGLHDYS